MPSSGAVFLCIINTFFFLRQTIYLPLHSSTHDRNARRGLVITALKRRTVIVKPCKVSGSSVAMSRTTAHLLSESHTLRTQCGRFRGSVPTTVIPCNLITEINCERLEALTAYLPVLGCVSSQHPSRRSAEIILRRGEF